MRHPCSSSSSSSSSSPSLVKKNKHLWLVPNVVEPHVMAVHKTEQLIGFPNIFMMYKKISLEVRKTSYIFSRPHICHTIFWRRRMKCWWWVWNCWSFSMIATTLYVYVNRGKKKEGRARVEEVKGGRAENRWAEMWWK